MYVGPAMMSMRLQLTRKIGKARRDSVIFDWSMQTLSNQKLGTRPCLRLNSSMICTAEHGVESALSVLYTQLKCSLSYTHTTYLLDCFELGDRVVVPRVGQEEVNLSRDALLPQREGCRTALARKSAAAPA